MSQSAVLSYLFGYKLASFSCLKDVKFAIFFLTLNGYNALGLGTGIRFFSKTGY